MGCVGGEAAAPHTRGVWGRESSQEAQPRIKLTHPLSLPGNFHRGPIAPTIVQLVRDGREDRAIKCATVGAILGSIQTKKQKS